MKARIDRDDTEARLPVIGAIRIGEKHRTEGGKEIPRSLDYFRADGEKAWLFHKHYGEQPRSVQITFLSDNLYQVAFERWEIRNNGKRWAYGDGEEFHVWDEKHGEYRVFYRSDHPDIKERVAQKCDGPWRVVLTLRFYILGLPVMGVWQFSTSGNDTSIPQIVSVLNQVQESAGTLQWIPFDMSVKMVKSDKPGSKSRYPVVTVVPNLDDDNMRKIKSLGGYHNFGLLTAEKVQEITTEARALPEGYIDAEAERADHE